MMKNKIDMDKPIRIGQTVSDLNKLLIYEFFYVYMIPKWGKEKIWVWRMDSDSLAIQIKSLAFYKDKAKDVKTRYDASNYEKK